jgi:hypothetical protein
MNASDETSSLSPQNVPPLLRLPVKLHLIIASYLRSYSNPEHLQYPRSTSRYFHHLTPPPFRPHFAASNNSPTSKRRIAALGAVKYVAICNCVPKSFVKTAGEKYSKCGTVRNMTG